ncbi:hypothetical protein ACWDSD_45870 [Streptomyces spiralis]
MYRSREWIFERIRRDRRLDSTVSVSDFHRTRGTQGHGGLSTSGEYGFEVPAPSAWMRWLPAAWIAFVIVISFLLPSQWATSFLLIALPVIAAYVLGPAAVAGITVFAIVLEGILASLHHHLWDDHHIAAYIATALVGILGAVLAAHRRSQERSLVHANSVAEALMRTLLRPVPHQIGHVLAAALYRPGEVGTMVGGDLYDILETKAGERAVIGDVRGKGLRGPNKASGRGGG